MDHPRARESRSRRLSVAHQEIRRQRRRVLLRVQRKVMSESQRLGATPYDVKEVELGHHEQECSFEAILKRYGLTGDPALVLLGRIAILPLLPSAFPRLHSRPATSPGPSRLTIHGPERLRKKHPQLLATWRSQTAAARRTDLSVHPWIPLAAWSFTRWLWTMASRKCATYQPSRSSLAKPSS